MRERRVRLRRTAFAWALYAAALAHGATALPTPDVLREGIPHDALYDVCFDARGGLAVGAAGVLLESDTGGRVWTQNQAPLTPLALLGVACATDRRIAVGQEGTVLVDEGTGWQAVASGSDQRLLAVAANDKGLAVAVGGFGTVLVSRDGGSYWESVSFDWPAIVEDFAEPHLYDVAIAPDGAVTIVGEFELVMRSEDEGRTWQRLNRGDASLFGLHLSPDGSGFAVGQQGRVLRTRDGGLSWEAGNAPVDALLLAVWSDPAGPVLVSGMRTMLYSADAGESWRALEGADVNVGWYSGLSAAGDGPDTRLISVGNVGRVLGMSVPAKASDHNQKR